MSVKDNDSPAEKDDGASQSGKLATVDSTRLKRRRGKRSLKRRKDLQENSDEGEVLRPRRVSRIVCSPSSPSSSSIDSTSGASPKLLTPHSSPVSKPKLDDASNSHPPISLLAKSSDSSAPSSPVMVSSVKPLHRLPGEELTMEDIRNEMVDYIYRHRNPGVTLQLLTALLVDHLNESNRPQFVHLLLSLKVFYFYLYFSSFIVHYYSLGAPGAYLSSIVFFTGASTPDSFPFLFVGCF